MTATWITGAGGFIGRYLARRLRRLDGQLIGLGLEADVVPDEVTGAVKGELGLSLFERAAQLGGPPTTVYHLAGSSSVGASIRDPEGERGKTLPGFAGLLDWLKNQAPAARIVLASSAAVYGESYDHPIPESALTRPISPYGMDKLEMERQLAAAGEEWGLHSAVVRLFSVYGPGLKRQLLWDLCRRLETAPSSLALSGTGAERRDFLHVTDAVTLLETVASLASPSKPTWNGGTGVGRTVRSIAEDAARAWAWPCIVAFNGEPREGDPKSQVADVTAAKAIGFAPAMSWESGLAGVLTWYREERA